MTFISVIVPVYNIEEVYLRRCIDSILNQIYKDFELILSDDGSTDGSGKVCDLYASTDNRVRVIHKENGGSSSARNEAIKIAKGEYLAFIDSDDYIEPDFLQTLVRPVEEAKKKGESIPRIVQTGRDERDENGKELPSICVHPEEEIFTESRDFLKELLMHIGDCSFCTKLTAKSLFDGREFPVGKLNEDFFLLIQMLPECQGVARIPFCGYHVFYRIGSNTRKKEKNGFSRVYRDNVENADFVYGLVKEKYPELERIAMRFGLFQRLDYLLHIPIDYMKKDNSEYIACVSFVRKHWSDTVGSKYLTVKNKLYLTLFAIAPRLVRVVHAKIKHIG